MGFRKFGDSSDGRVIPEDDDDRKTAKKNWSDKDSEELAEENRRADGQG